MQIVDYGYSVENGKPSIESLEELSMKFNNDFIAKGNFEAAIQIVQHNIQNLTVFFNDNYDNFLDASKNEYNNDFNYIYKFLTCYSNIWQIFAITLGNTGRFGSAENAAFMAGTILPIELPDARETMNGIEKIRSTVAELGGNPLTISILTVTRDFTNLSDSVLQCMKNLNNIFR